MPRGYPFYFVLGLYCPKGGEYVRCAEGYLNTLEFFRKALQNRAGQSRLLYYYLLGVQIGYESL